MKNILSYKKGTIFLGKEIKEWLEYHLTNKTSLSKKAEQMKKYLNIKDNMGYFIVLTTPSCTCGKYKRRPRVIKN